MVVVDFFEYLLEEALVYSVEEAFEKVVVALIFYLMVFLMEESWWWVGCERRRAGRRVGASPATPRADMSFSWEWWVGENDREGRRGVASVRASVRVQ